MRFLHFADCTNTNVAYQDQGKLCNSVNRIKESFFFHQKKISALKKALFSSWGDLTSNSTQDLRAKFGMCTSNGILDFIGYHRNIKP